MKRVSYIDNLKALAIILVVLGHIFVFFSQKYTDVYGILSYFIYCFHMPLFFALSGWAYYYTKMGDDNVKVLKRILNFGYDTIIYGIISVLFIDKLMTINGFKSLFTLLGLAANEYWFLPVLSVIYIIMLIFNKIKIKNDLILSMCLFLLCMLVGLINMTIAKYILYLLFFNMGIWLSKNKIKFKQNYSILFGILFILFSVFYYFYSHGKLLDNVYIKFILGISACYVLAYLFKSTKSNNLLKNIGSNTLIIYLTHSFTIKCYFKNVIVNRNATFFDFLIICFILVVLYYLIFMIFKKFKESKRILLNPIK